MSDPDRHDDAIASFAAADVVLLTVELLSVTPDVADEEIQDLVHAACGSGNSPLLLAVRSMLDQARQTDPGAWRHERTRLFNGPVVCPVNETAYVRRDKGAIIADICGFYRAFGFEPDSTGGEKADHLACELEFVGVLLAMLGETQRAGDADKADIVRSATRAFLADHLGEWLGLFCHRLAATAELPLYGGTVDLLAAVWDLLATRFDMPRFETLNADPDPDTLEDDGTPYECDMAEATQREPFVPLRVDGQ